MTTLAQIRDKVHAKRRADFEAQEAEKAKRDAETEAVLTGVAELLTDVSVMADILRDAVEDLNAMYGEVAKLTNVRLTLEEAQELSKHVQAIVETHRPFLDTAEDVLAEEVFAGMPQCDCDCCGETDESIAEGTVSAETLAGMPIVININDLRLAS